MSQPRQLDGSFVPRLAHTAPCKPFQHRPYLPQVECSYNKIVPAYDRTRAFDLRTQPCWSAYEDIERFLTLTACGAEHCLQQDAEAARVRWRIGLQIMNVGAVKPLQNRSHGRRHQPSVWKGARRIKIRRVFPSGRRTVKIGGFEDHISGQIHVDVFALLSQSAPPSSRIGRRADGTRRRGHGIRYVKRGR